MITCQLKLIYTDISLQLEILFLHSNFILYLNDH